MRCSFVKKIFALLLCIVLLCACLPTTAFAATIITRVELSLNLPVAGVTPPKNCSIHGNGYTIHSIDWNEIGGRGFLEAKETFREGYTYEATLWVKASDGYEFSYADSKTPAITGYINDKAVSVSKAYEYNAWAMVCLTVRFNNIPGKGWIKEVNLSVPAPVAGETPSYTRIVGNGYATANVYFGSSTNETMLNGIDWYGDRVGLKPGQDKFADNTAYTFHCLVFPDDGFRFTEDATVYVNGKEANASLDYDMFLSVNFTFPATGKAHTHTYTDWAWNSGQHYKNCTGCDEVFFVESHTGGMPTCSSDGICTVCGFAYLPASEDYHNPDTGKWIGRSDWYHYHACMLCGAHCDIEDHRWSPTYLYQDSKGHAWICADCKAVSAIEKHNPGPAATESSPQTCKDCGYIIAPAKNHKHDLTKVPQTPATCMDEGNIEYYFCTGCNDCFTDAEGKNRIPDDMSVAVGALGHTPSEVWGVDEDFHWRVCTTCNQVLDETKMVHDMINGKCATCAYDEEAPATEVTTEATEATEPTQPTEPATAQTRPQKTENSDIPWLFLVGIGFGAIAVGIGLGLLLKKRR